MRSRCLLVAAAPGEYQKQNLATLPDSESDADAVMNQSESDDSSSTRSVRARKLRRTAGPGGGARGDDSSDECPACDGSCAEGGACDGSCRRSMAASRVESEKKPARKKQLTKSEKQQRFATGDPEWAQCTGCLKIIQAKRLKKHRLTDSCIAATEKRAKSNSTEGGSDGGGGGGGA